MMKAAKIAEGNFLRTGVEGLDALFTLGIPKGAAVIIEGGPGCGKTMLSLEMAYNYARAGKKVLYMSFEEPEDKLLVHMKESLGCGVGKTKDKIVQIEELIKKDYLRIKRFSALDIARSVEALLTEAKKELLIDVHPILVPKDYDPDIVMFDSLTSISSAFSGEKYRFRIYMEQLFRYLEGHKINSFLIRETPRPTHIGMPMSMDDEAVSFLSDGIIILYNVFYRGGKRGRAIEVLKMRGDNINKKIVKMEIISQKGIVILPDEPLAEKNEDYTLT